MACREKFAFHCFFFHSKTFGDDNIWRRHRQIAQIFPNLSQFAALKLTKIVLYLEFPHKNVVKNKRVSPSLALTKLSWNLPKYVRNFTKSNYQNFLGGNPKKPNLLRRFFTHIIRYFDQIHNFNFVHKFFSRVNAIHSQHTAAELINYFFFPGFRNHALNDRLNPKEFKCGTLSLVNIKT